jgi:hypothetical protein
MTDDDARRAILSRRARFIAAAMLGTGLATCKSGEPAVCLSPVRVPEPQEAPMVCLSVALSPQLPPDGTGATADGGADDGSTDAGATGAKPRRGSPPRPTICLRK